MFRLHCPFVSIDIELQMPAGPLTKRKGRRIHHILLRTAEKPETPFRFASFLVGLIVLPTCSAGLLPVI